MRTDWNVPVGTDRPRRQIGYRPVCVMRQRMRNRAPRILQSARSGIFAIGHQNHGTLEREFPVLLTTRPKKNQRVSR